MAGVLVLALAESSASGGASVVRFKVVDVTGKLSGDVTAGYGAFQCPGKTPSLFTGTIHGRRPGKPVGQQTQYGTVYNDLFDASVRRSGGSYKPATGRGRIFAQINVPIVTEGTGEAVGCHPYDICDPHNEMRVMDPSIKLQRIGRRGWRMVWDPGGEVIMPRGDDLPPLNGVGLVPIYNCLDTYFPFAQGAPAGKAACPNKPLQPGTLARNSFVVHLKCAFNRPDFHPYTDGDGTRNVTERASIEANIKVKRVN